MTEQGNVTTQRRYIPLTASIRLCTKLARRLDEDLTISFDDSDWQDFRSFIKIRNRLTHPKTTDDLKISSGEARLCITAFFWISDIVTCGMEAANKARKQYLSDFERILDRLKAGDPQMLAEYRAAALDQDEAG